ncbi:MAG: hypothetical protein K0V04_06100, partial [Deltaproteobacteria bacterium]|nr:hypothetical protein [Deltaproteobacteria bacterium]
LSHEHGFAAEENPPAPAVKDAVKLGEIITTKEGLACGRCHDLGDVPAELLTETEDAPVEPVAPRPRRRRSAATPAEAKPRAKSGPHSPTRRLAEHLDGEASDVNAEITDLGTERLPSKRRRDGSEISAVTDIGRTGFTERVVTEPSPSVAEDPAADDPVFARDSTSDDGAFAVASLRAADSGTGPSRRGWVLQAIGLAALVAVAAAVGALMARPSGGAAVAKQAPVAVPPPAQPARLADVGALAAGEPSAVQAPASDGSSGGGSTTGGVEATSTDGAGGSTAGSDSGSDGGSETGAAAVVNIPTTPPPPRRGAPTPRRKKTDAAVKKKLRREIQRHCVDEVSGYRTKIEGFIGEGGRVTGVRIIDGPSAARGCIKGLVEARRFPPGELRNLDLTVTL